nr:hypothetical protein [uncultured Rhodoferax sp.]
MAKFSDSQVAQIKRMRSEGATYVQIAMEVGCCLAYAQKVVAGKLRAGRPARNATSLTAEDLPTVRACYANGYGVERIARALKATFSSTLVLVREARHFDGPPPVRQSNGQTLTPQGVAEIVAAHAEMGAQT